MYKKSSSYLSQYASFTFSKKMLHIKNCLNSFDKIILLRLTTCQEFWECVYANVYSGLLNARVQERAQKIPGSFKIASKQRNCCNVTATTFSHNGVKIVYKVLPDGIVFYI